MRGTWASRGGAEQVLRRAVVPEALEEQDAIELGAGDGRMGG
jgi:hypothetical protein